MIQVSAFATFFHEWLGPGGSGAGRSGRRPRPRTLIRLGAELVERAGPLNARDRATVPFEEMLDDRQTDERIADPIDTLDAVELGHADANVRHAELRKAARPVCGV